MSLDVRDPLSRTSKNARPRHDHAAAGSQTLTPSCHSQPCLHSAHVAFLWSTQIISNEKCRAV